MPVKRLWRVTGARFSHGHQWGHAVLTVALEAPFCALVFGGAAMWMLHHAA
jgi:hypothetical protein